MTPKLIDRLARLETRQASSDSAEPIPPGMVAVMMWSVATRLGGFPRARNPETHLSDTVSDGLARGLGYRDYEEMDRHARRDFQAWGARMDEGFTALLRTEGIVRGETDDAEIFAGLVRIMDDAAAVKSRYGSTPGWTDMAERLDDWISYCGFLPSTVRAEAGA
jgi:hypothetical protein